MADLTTGTSLTAAVEEVGEEGARAEGMVILTVGTEEEEEVAGAGMVAVDALSHFLVNLGEFFEKLSIVEGVQMDDERKKR